MPNSLAIPKGKKVKDPMRQPDFRSARGVPYWWGPTWLRKAGSTTFGRIIPIKVEGKEYPELHMLSKDGNLSYIRGRIQEEFRKWHDDHEIDCILLGMDPEDILLTDWEYE